MLSSLKRGSYRPTNWLTRLQYRKRPSQDTWFVTTPSADLIEAEAATVSLCYYAPFKNQLMADNISYGAGTNAPVRYLQRSPTRSHPLCSNHLRWITGESQVKHRWITGESWAIPTASHPPIPPPSSALFQVIHQLRHWFPTVAPIPLSTWSIDGNVGTTHTAPILIRAWWLLPAPPSSLPPTPSHPLPTCLPPNEFIKRSFRLVTANIEPQRAIMYKNLAEPATAQFFTVTQQQQQQQQQLRKQETIINND